MLCMSLLTEFVILNGMEFIDYYEDYLNLCQVSKNVKKIVKQSNVYSANMLLRGRNFYHTFLEIEQNLPKTKKFACLNIYVDTKYFFNARLHGLRLFMESFKYYTLNIRSISSGLDVSSHEKMLSVILQINVYHALYKVYGARYENSRAIIKYVMETINWDNDISNNFRCYERFFNNMICFCATGYIDCIKCDQYAQDAYLS